MTAFSAVFRADLFTRGQKDVGNVSGLEVKINKTLRESDDNISDPSWAFDYVSYSQRALLSNKNLHFILFVNFVEKRYCR